MEHTLSLYVADRPGKKRRRRGRMGVAILAGIILTAALPRAPKKIEPAAQVGVRVGTPISIVRSEPLPQPQPLPAKATITPSRLVFADRDASAQFAVIRNDGGTAIDRVDIDSDAPFVATNGCAGGVAAGAQCVVAVVFAPPKGGGKFAGTLQIAAGSDRASVALRGTASEPAAIPPKVVLPPVRRLCFDPPAIHFEAPGSQSVTLTNPEKAPLRVVSIVPTNLAGYAASGYAIDATPCIRTLAAGEQCAFAIAANKRALALHERMLIDVTYEDPETGIRRGAMSSSACGAN